MAETRHEFQQLARMRLRDARLLIRGGRPEAAYYLTGLAVECAVKACIAKNTKRHHFPPNQGAIKDIYTHDLVKLVGAARLQAALEADRRRNAAFNNKWDVVKDWNINSRYIVKGLNARDLYRAVAGRNGVMQWLRQLVNNDIEIGRRIVAALTQSSIPVTVYLWAFVPQLQEWQFTIATPLVDSKGPLATYGEVNKALQKGGVFDEVPLRRIFLKSPNDKVLKLLEKESRAVPQESFRVVNEQIAGNFVEDAYLYKGFISIAQLRRNLDADPPLYSIFYAPYEGPAGIVPDVRIRGSEALRNFLIDRLRANQESVNSALRRLDERGIAAIPNVELKPGELKRLGLA